MTRVGKHLLGGVLTGLGSLALAMPVRAQVSNFHITQQVPLVVVDPSQTTLASAGPAMINLQVSEPVSIIASPPIPDGFNDPAGTQRTSEIASNTATATHGEPLPLSQTGSVDLGLSMQVARPYAYPPGHYTYRVFLTVVPQ